jgi:hypothetical protein
MSSCKKEMKWAKGKLKEERKFTNNIDSIMTKW